ncbi:hairy-related 2 isoform X1 [Sinocyclocheilus grahami]|uniref:hairy-related 2 isoform X1 n=1 Tax=Sinocyclocheilus grahami TaxID=75366 RepID=UPI0007AD1866|nr:PREDICTED: transcription factor HES-5-like isoform X1 [Sinocyclocheilus grahami]XP_016096310.1 PREDICTED: transcription factor HES-5-like isoform X1 [Sinocyclocheilus grahami]XP_016096311.1 PREDICTED: transcription factor HES-5-like isoform X1 [Sinocyclocheilus grahami]
MAPTVCKLTHTGKEKTKTRKPEVEKMRRDRINRCIEQLKVLLKAEIKASQPCSKLEKADVLEMAVIYLKSNACPSAHAQSYAHGFSRCIEETARFMAQQIAKPDLMGQCDTTQRAEVSAESAGDSCQLASKRSGEHALWRPW